MVTGRGMRLKRAMGSGRKFSTHNALWCLFTHCGELWVVCGKVSRLLKHHLQSLSWVMGHHVDDVQTFIGNISVHISSITSKYS